MRVVEIKQTCGSCPEQWEGLLEDGRHVYVRVRHYRARVGVGVTLDSAIADQGVSWQLATDHVGWEGLGLLLSLAGLILTADTARAELDYWYSHKALEPRGAGLLPRRVHS